ncbi:MAG: hypothetical protein KF864_15435 [Phycisphaeraceae bacterium]|nr:hypothetical protein [Phycisphaeraceae bacterium]
MKPAEQTPLSISLRPALGGISLLILVALTVQLPGAEWSYAGGQRSRIGEFTRAVAHTIRLTQVRHDEREPTRPARQHPLFAGASAKPLDGDLPRAAREAPFPRRPMVCFTSLPPPPLA